MRISFTAKVVGVIAVASAIGVSMGVSVSRAVGRQRDPNAHFLRISSKTGKISTNMGFEKGKGHSTLTPLKDNAGTPGVLNVRAAFQVADANKIRKDRDKDKPFVVEVHVEDMEGTVVVDCDQIGVGVDKAGDGDWEQVFGASYRLPRGEYVVDMLLHNPEKKLRSRDGTVIGPAQVGYARWPMTVR